MVRNDTINIFTSLESIWKTRHHSYANIQLSMQQGKFQAQVVLLLLLSGTTELVSIGNISSYRCQQSVALFSDSTSAQTGLLTSIARDVFNG